MGDILEGKGIVKVYFSPAVSAGAYKSWPRYTLHRNTIQNILELDQIVILPT